MPTYPNALAQANPQRNLLAAQMLQASGEGSYLRQQFPQVYGFLGGLAGTAPDEMQGSALDPNTAAVRQGASYGYLPGLVASSAPLGKAGAGLGMLAGATRGAQKFDNFVLTGAKDKQQIPFKEITRFDDGGLQVGYKRGDSQILVSLAPTSKNDRMLTASLENIGGYPSGTGDATMAYVDALESAVKNKFGKPVYWDGFTSESIQSNQARAIYDRLKKAGIPFEKNVFTDRSNNALSLTQNQLLDIDFDKVRSNLIKSAAIKKKNQVDLSDQKFDNTALMK